jgi:hypothetical protein
MTTWLPLLLADPSPCLRMLVLRDLMHRSDDDPELLELAALREADPLVADALRLQAGDGSWSPAHFEGNAPGGVIQMTALVLARLGYLGFGAEHPAVQRGAAYLFAQQRDDGSWPLAHRAADIDGGYDIISLQTSVPLRGLAACGYATDPRAERAYEWLLAQRLPDGAWPTGIASGVYGYVGGYRRLAHSRWGCRSNTTGALIALALHSERRRGSEARRALDLLLGRETRETQHVGFEVARLVGAEPVSGWFTFFARFDLALVVDLCWRVGAGVDDARVADLVAFLRRLQGDYGLWAYGPRPQVSRWVTFDLLRSLSRLDETTGWVSAEPRTPFQPYGSIPKRY